MSWQREMKWAELLGEALREYATHASWRCEYPTRYPWDECGDEGCPCGLVGFVRRCEEMGLVIRPPLHQTQPENVDKERAA